jgi:hypothetical protein
VLHAPGAVLLVRSADFYFALHAPGAVLLACRADGGDADESSDGTSSGDLPAGDSGPGSPDKCAPGLPAFSYFHDWHHLTQHSHVMQRAPCMRIVVAFGQHCHVCME